jgi:hypothetical protein
LMLIFITPLRHFHAITPLIYFISRHWIAVLIPLRH